MITRRKLAMMLGAETLHAAPFMEKADIFESGKDGYELYRIPGLAVTKKGTVLAYCEARKTGRGDWGAIDIYLRRSEDHGRTFGPRAKIAEVPGPHQKNPMAAAQNLGKAGEVTYNNPVAIPDAKTGAVHFVFCYEYMRAFYMRSDDDGRTFTAPVEITATFDEFRREYAWKVLATGPGHGIQLRNGRLVIPVWISTATGGHAHRPSVTATIYSDDHGKTWKRGGIAIPDTPEFIIPNETCAVELRSGGVLLNARSESKAHRRILVTSKDGATGWSKPKFHPDLLEPVCMGSMARLSKNRLLFSNPDNLEVSRGKPVDGKNRDRRNLTVKLSYDESATWPVKRVIEPGWSGYSDLAVARDRTILCLYERGGLGDDHFRTAALTLARFNLEWLSDGKDRM
jgi:sialidase-1